MNDVVKQFNKRAEEIKPVNHQRALKMVVLKALQSEHVKHRDTKWGLFLSIFSMSITKKLLTGLGVVLFAAVAVVGWNPLLKKVGIVPSVSTYTYAQEMLVLTREQINALSVAEKAVLLKQIGGNLEAIWQEAEQANDLQFLQDKEAHKAFMNDFKTVRATSTYEGIYSGLLTDVRTRAFRYTDQKGRISYILLDTLEPHAQALAISPGTNIITVTSSTPTMTYPTILQVVRFKNTSSFDKSINGVVTKELHQKIIQQFNQRLQIKFPRLWLEAQADPQAAIKIIGPDQEKQWSNIGNEKNTYFGIKNFFEARIQLKTSHSDESSETEISSEDPPLGLVVFTFSDQKSRKYWVETIFDLTDVSRIYSHLEVWERTEK